MNDPLPASRSRAFFAKRIASYLCDMFLPPLCLGCKRPVAVSASLCSGCWAQLSFIAPPCCQKCGAPFPFKTEAETLCVDCLEDLPGYGMARSALLYDDTSSPLLLGFKHGDKTLLAPLFARMLSQAGTSILRAADFLIPVPLHRSRLWKRRYNQSALLCIELEKLLAADGRKIKSLNHALIRLRATSRQQGNAEKRRRNVAGAFGINTEFAHSIAGKNIVLIDDVMTTGATVRCCAECLLDKGAARVDVLTIARAGTARDF